MAAPPSCRLHSMLQTAVQTVQWTYSVFWQLCPQQGVLVWADGFYNGAIKTRKTVQATEEESPEEMTLGRSQQLRELYDSLAAGEANPPTRRPSAALSPEDLTESEWFYLMCISFSFPPGAGLPGKAFAKRQHVWLSSACHTDSKLFSRAILAKSARIQTVLCIPRLDGVIELGTTEKVAEDLEFVQTIKSFFIDHQSSLGPKPALSEHSTSNPTTSSEPNCFHSSTLRYAATNDPNHMDDQINDKDENQDEDKNVNADIEDETELDSESKSGHNKNPSRNEIAQSVIASLVAAEASELMQLDMSEDIRVGSPDDGSNQLDSNVHLLAINNNAKSMHHWGDSPDLKDNNLLISPSEISPELEELMQEDSHYCQTVSTILQHQSSQWPDSSTTPDVMSSTHSAFTRWSNTIYTSTHQHSYIDQVVSSQRLLKYTLFTVPLLHARPHNAANTDTSLFSKHTPQEELSDNHVLAERRRREKLNERFIILRSLVPFVTRMDKASILSDAIEYLKQLHRKIQDLETCKCQMEADLLRSGSDGKSHKNTIKRRRNGPMMTKLQTGLKKRKKRIVEGDGGAGGKSKEVVHLHDVVHVEVSIIENDALVEFQCPSREGLLLDVMQMLRELKVEVTAVQSSPNNGQFVAELRAKVKENVNGEKASIAEVKRAMHQIIPHY